VFLPFELLRLFGNSSGQPARQLGQSGFSWSAVEKIDKGGRAIVSGVSSPCQKNAFLKKGNQLSNFTTQRSDRRSLLLKAQR
jgi:hypothetical protein